MEVFGRNFSKAKSGIELISQMRAVAQMGTVRVNYSSDKISRHIRNSFADKNIIFREAAN